jgi:TonB family protein
VTALLFLGGGPVMAQRPGEAARAYDVPPKLIRNWSTPYLRPKHGPKKPPDDNVVLEILIDTRGRVTQARVVKSIPFYDDVAIATVKAWIFSPALKDEKPVTVRQLTSVHFGKVVDRGQVLLWDEFVAPSPAPSQAADAPDPLPTPASPPASLPPPATQPRPLAPLAGPQPRMELLSVDTQGADFAGWIEKANDTVSRNWTGPKPSEAASASEGQFEVVVERDGSVSTARIVKRSDTAAFDRAALKVLFGTVLPRLPDTYPAPRARMLVRLREDRVEP